MMVVDAQRNRAGSVSRNFLRADPGLVKGDDGQPGGAGKEVSMPAFYSAGNGVK